MILGWKKMKLISSRWKVRVIRLDLGWLDSLYLVKLNIRLWVQIHLNFSIHNKFIKSMCKYSSGCASSSSFNCKSCGTALCKQCNRSLATGNPPASGNAAQCGDCKKNFRWSYFPHIISLNLKPIFSLYFTFFTFIHSFLQYFKTC